MECPRPSLSISLVLFPSLLSIYVYGVKLVLSNWLARGTQRPNDRGVKCIFVDYPLDHTGDIYEMWDHITGGLPTTRDIIWMGGMFFEKGGKVKPITEDLSPATVLATSNLIGTETPTGLNSNRTRTKFDLTLSHRTVLR